MCINPDLLAELVRVTEGAQQLWSGVEVSARSAADVYRRACSVLRSLAGDENFKRCLHETVTAARNHEGEAEKMLHDLDSYLHFLKIEKSILIEAGMNNQTADMLLHHATLFRHRVSLSQAVASSSYETLGRELSVLAEKVCAAANEMERVAARNRRWVFVRQLGLEVGGWTIIGGNSASFVAELIATSGLTLSVGSVSLLSTALGRGLIVAAKEA